MLPIGPAELVVVLVIVLLVVGPGKLPETGRAVGRGLREFRDGLSGRAEAEPAGQPSGIGDVARPTK